MAKEGKDDVQKLSFEEGLKILEGLVSQVEGGSMPLEDSLKAFEKGNEVVAHLRSILSRAEEKISLFKKESTK